MGFSSEEYQRSINSSSSIGTKIHWISSQKVAPPTSAQKSAGDKSKVLNKLPAPKGFRGTPVQGATGLQERSLSALNTLGFSRWVLCYRSRVSGSLGLPGMTLNLILLTLPLECWAIVAILRGAGHGTQGSTHVTTPQPSRELILAPGKGQDLKSFISTLLSQPSL